MCENRRHNFLQVINLLMRLMLANGEIESTTEVKVKIIIH